MVSTESRVTVEILRCTFLATVVSCKAPGGHLATINKALAWKESVRLSLKGSHLTDGSFWSRWRGVNVALVGKSDIAEKQGKRKKSAPQTDKSELKSPQCRLQRITRFLFCFFSFLKAKYDFKVEDKYSMLQSTANIHHKKVYRFSSLCQIYALISI